MLEGEGAIHIIQRVQCTVGVRVTVLALHRQFPFLLHCQSLPSTLPFLPVLGVPGGFLSPLFCVGIGGPCCRPAPPGPLLTGVVLVMGVVLLMGVV